MGACTVDSGHVADIITDAIVSATMDIPELAIRSEYSMTSGIWRLVTRGCKPGTVRIMFAMYPSNDITILNGYEPDIIFSMKRGEALSDDTRPILGRYLPDSGSVPGIDRMMMLLHDASHGEQDMNLLTRSMITPMLSRILVSMWPQSDLPWKDRGTFDRPMGPFVDNHAVGAFRHVLADTDLDDRLPGGFAIQDLLTRLKNWYDRWPGDPAVEDDM